MKNVFYNMVQSLCEYRHHPSILILIKPNGAHSQTILLRFPFTHLRLWAIAFHKSFKVHAYNRGDRQAVRIFP